MMNIREIKHQQIAMGKCAAAQKCETTKQPIEFLVKLSRCNDIQLIKFRRHEYDLTRWYSTSENEIEMRAIKRIYRLSGKLAAISREKEVQ